MRKRPAYPPACSLCSPYGGLYRNWGTETAPKLDRCDCARGKALGLGAKWGRKPRKRKGPGFDGRAAGAGQ